MQSPHLTGHNYWYADPSEVLAYLHYFEKFRRQDANIASLTASSLLSGLINLVRAMFASQKQKLELVDPISHLPYPQEIENKDVENLGISPQAESIARSMLSREDVPGPIKMALDKILGN